MTNHHDTKTRLTCEAPVTVPGPHPGCAEFAPPEEFICGQPAAYRTTVRDRETFIEDTYLTCLGHHPELIAPSPFETVVDDEPIEQVKHTIRWFAVVDGTRIARRSWMTPANGWHGFDATCSCGWDSRTGGALQARIDDAVRDHKWEVEG